MENLAHLFSMDMVMVTLRMAIPLILASIGSVICERSGIINLGIEGMMLMGQSEPLWGLLLHQFLGLELHLRLLWVDYSDFYMRFYVSNIIQTRRSAELELTFLLLD